MSITDWSITDWVEIATDWDEEGEPCGGFIVPKEYVERIKALDKQAQVIRANSYIIPKEYVGTIGALIHIEEAPEE